MAVINRLIIMMNLFRQMSKMIGWRGRKVGVSVNTCSKYAFRHVFVSNQYKYTQRAMQYFSTLKTPQIQNRKLLEISESIIPSLLQKKDLSSVVEIIRQMVLALITQLFKIDRPESKRVLLFIFQLIIQLEPNFQKNQTESLSKTLKLLSQHIDELNDTELIIATNELHLRFIERLCGKANNDYIIELSKFAENLISGDHIDKALECFSEIQKLISLPSISISNQLVIQNMINLGIIYLSKGDTQASLQAYSRALKITQETDTPNFQAYKIAIYQCLGDIYKDRHQFEQAFDSYEHSLIISTACFSEININSLILLFKISKVCFELKRFEEVVSKCQIIDRYLSADAQLFEQFEYYDEMTILMGKSFALLRKNAQAIECFEKYVSNAEKSVIIQERRYVQVMNALIDTSLNEGKKENALKHLKSLGRYYKIEGNNLKLEQCEERMHKIQKQLKT